MSHINMIVYGYDMQMTDKRTYQWMLDAIQIPPKFQLTQQVKQFFDTLYNIQVSPSKQFEKFLIAINSIIIPQTLIQSNQQQLYSTTIQTDNQDYELEPSQSQNEQIIVEQSSPIINKMDSSATLVENELTIKNHQERSNKYLNELSDQLLQNIQWLINYVLAYKKYILQFYLYFQQQIRQYLYQLKNNKEYKRLNIDDTKKVFRQEVSKFICDYINEEIIKAANKIYEILTQQFSPNDHILIYSPSKLIINSVIIYNEYLQKSKQQNDFCVTLIYNDKLLLHNQLEKLAEHNVKVNYVNLSHLPYYLQQQKSSVMLVGCQEITKNANAVSRAGCVSAAIFCQQANIPIIAVTETYKFGCQEGEQAEGIEILESKYLQAVICEYGVLSCQSVRTKCL